MSRQLTLNKQFDLFGNQIEIEKHEQLPEKKQVTTVARKIEEFDCKVVPYSFHKQSPTITWIWNIKK